MDAESDFCLKRLPASKISWRKKKDWAQTTTPFLSSVKARLMMLSLDLMLLYPGMKGNFKATPLFKEILTALNLLENILIALPRDKKHRLLKHFCCYHLHLTLIFLLFFIFLCVVILRTVKC